MFIRSIKVPSSSGVVHEYVRVVESVREDGRVKQKLVLNLGRRDTLVTLLPMVQRFLQGDATPSLPDDGADASARGQHLGTRPGGAPFLPAARPLAIVGWLPTLATP